MTYTVETQSDGVTIRNESGQFLWIPFSEVESVVAAIRAARTEHVIYRHLARHKSVSTAFLDGGDNL